jgi:hypothetical protein
VRGFTFTHRPVALCGWSASPADGLAAGKFTVTNMNNEESRIAKTRREDIWVEVFAWITIAAVGYLIFRLFTN